MKDRVDPEFILWNLYVTENANCIVLVGDRDLKEPQIESVPIDLKVLENAAKSLISASSKTRGHSDGPSRSVGEGDRYDKEPAFADLDRVLQPLIAKLVQRTVPGELIWIIPHKIFHRIPFHAILYEGQPLGFRNPVVYSPNLTAMKYCIGRPLNRHGKKMTSLIAHVYGLKDPSILKMSLEEETAVVADCLDVETSTILKNCQVTRDTFLNQAQEVDIIHFAGHGFTDPSDPMNSGILVSDGISLPDPRRGVINPETMKITARDILATSLNARLVTLSACVTGVSQREAGDELLGISRAVLYSGASSMLLSLWPVFTEAATEWMSTFYRTYMQGNTKVYAWQEACRHVCDSKILLDMSHPWFWAPFILIGDWQ